jgi:hypothetical protein
MYFYGREFCIACAGNASRGMKRASRSAPDAARPARKIIRRKPEEADISDEQLLRLRAERQREKNRRTARESRARRTDRLRHLEGRAAENAERLDQLHAEIATRKWQLALAVGEPGTRATMRAPGLCKAPLRVPPLLILPLYTGFEERANDVEPESSPSLNYPPSAPVWSGGQGTANPESPPSAHRQ